MAARRGLLAGLLALIGAAASAPAAEQRPLALGSALLALDSSDPGRRRVGGLLWRGGLLLTADDPDFGGLSGLLVSPDGGEITAIGDGGIWVTARLRADANARIVGLEDGRIGRLRGPDGAALAGKAWRDAEALAALPEAGVLVAFEHRHRLWRYSSAEAPGQTPLAGRPEPFPAPPALADRPGNAGLEALAALADGRVVAFAQGDDAQSDHAGFLHQDGRWHGLTLVRRGGMTPAGAAQLPGGDLLVLERRPGWGEPFAARLRRIAIADVRPAGRLDGEVLAVLEPPLAVDNMEAVAARRGPDGEALVYLLSDDNFAADQRTLVLAFALAR